MYERIRDQLGSAGRRWRRLHVTGPFVLGLFVLAVVAGIGSDITGSEPAGFPIPSPYYRIIGNSGTHNISLLNLPVPYVGAPQVPIPVDVDGNLLPDVTVSLNLVNVPEGAIHNPPLPTDFLAQNLEINRLLTAPILGQSSPPLRLEIVYTLFDSQGQPPTTIQAGYDTGPGGSIPTYWKALLGGLPDFFNPLTIDLDTRPPLPNQYEQPTYRGPLSIVGAVDLPDQSFDFDLHYDPLPDDIAVSLATDDAGTHVTYNHNAPRDIDLDTTIAQLAADGSKVDIHARIDRLPREIAVDFASNEGIGDLDYRASNDGRAPDVGASIVSTPAPGSDDPPLVIDADIEGLPPEMNAHWELPDGGPMSFDFDSPYSGIGAIQAEVRDYFGADPASFAFVPTEQQFASYHKSGDRTLVRTRVERIRGVSFEQVDDGVDATLNVGDGQLPLEVQVVHDNFDGNGTAMDANAVVSPLPSELSFSMRTPDPGSTGEPLTVSYDTGESGQTADVDARVRIVEPSTTPATCGAPGVTCAELGIRHLPAHIEASVINVNPLDTRVAIDMEPRPNAAEPDVFASVVMAQKPEGNAPAPDPIVADVKIFGLPEHMRMRMANRLLDEDLPTEREAFERAEFHACSWDFDATTPGCTDAEGRIDAIDFGFRNFITGVPLPPLLPETPLWVTVAGRGGAEPTDSLRFEAKGHITDIGEVQLLNNDDVFGLRTDVGGNQDLSATIDIDSLPVVFEEATGSVPAVYHRIDLEATATISPLPQHLDFCFQQKDRAVVDPPTAPFVAACQENDPFGEHDGPDGVSRSPLALAYEGTNADDEPQEFDVKTVVDLNERGDADSIPDTPTDDQHVRGHVDVLHLPGTFSAYVDSPPDDAAGNPTDGPLRVLYDANDALGTDQITVDFALEVTDADFICRDPRQLPLGKKAMCAKAVIDNLPTEVWLFYDPSLPADNFVIQTSGSELIDITGLEATLVEGKLVDKHDPQTEDESDDVLETSVLVLTGQMLGLPQTVEGTLVLPGTVDMTATPPIEQVDLTVQNFIGPDPLPRNIPDQRAGVPGPAVVDQLFTIFQRDTLFRGTAHVTDLRGLAFATSRDKNNAKKLLDTNTIRVAFGNPDQTIRAYADMQYFAEHDADGDPVLSSLTSIIGDVTLQDVPEEVTLCIRGKQSVLGEPAEEAKTFCDRAPENSDEGAFSFVGDPGESAELMDIYGFVRFAKAGGFDVLAARVDLIDIPLVVQGRFRTENGSRVEFASFSDIDGQGFGVTPQGIGTIGFDLADFDIDSHGYNPAASPPWGAHSLAGTVEPFPAITGDQHLQLHLNDGDMRVRGSLDGLQGVVFGEEPCESPTPVPPESYPYYPIGFGETYTCIRAAFQDDTATGIQMDVLIDKLPKRIWLHDGGLTATPEYFQATIAKAAEMDTNDEFRTPCPPASEVTSAITCMPALIRVDTSGSSTLFGMLEVGTREDLATAHDFDALETLADVDATPADAPGVPAWSDWGPDRTGVRLRVVQHGKATEDDADDHTAITAGIRIAVPQSLTVDQFQNWDDTKDSFDGSGGDGRMDEASDVRFRFAVRRDLIPDADGRPDGGEDETVERIGELAALIHNVDEGEQILASQAGDNNEGRGLTIPGEIGITMFMRHHVVDKDKDQGCDDNIVCHDRRFIQIEGRSSASLDARVRILGGSSATIQRLSADILDLPSTAGVPDNEPSFMLRAEIDKNEPESFGLKDFFICIVWCVQTNQIGVESLDALVDFEPNDDGSPARRIDAYIVMDGAKNAMEIRGYGDIDDHPSNGGTEGFTAKVRLVTTDIDLVIHAGANPFFGFDMVMAGQLDVEASIVDAREFRLNQDLLHIRINQIGGPATDESFVDVDFHIYGLVAASFLWLVFLPPIPLYVATFLPPSLGPPDDGGLGATLLAFYDCDGFSVRPGDPLEFGDGDSINVGAWIGDPRFIRFGLAVPLVDLLLPRLVMCEIIGADLPLMGPTFAHPGTPFNVPHHAITGLDPVEPAPSPPIPDPPPPPELVLATGQPPLALCGAPFMQRAELQPGTVLQVATVADNTPIPFADVDTPPQPRCPAGSEGSLELNAGKEIDISGTIEGPAAPGRLIITADHILVDDNGTNPDANIEASTGKVTLLSNGTIDIEGEIHADAVIAANTGTATGGGGAGQGGAGGDVAGIVGTGGAPTGDDLFDPIEDTNDPDLGRVPIQPGSGGSTPGVGTAGAGGGMLYIAGSVVNVAAGAEVTADGSGGSNNHAAQEHCAVNVVFNDTNPDPDIDNSHTDFHANTGQRGGGGGSGGTIFISGIKVNLNGAVTAIGGPGGEGIAGGGGGGSGGIVKISAALLNGAPDVTGGDGGLSTCPTNPAPSFFSSEADAVLDANGRPEFPAGGHGADLRDVTKLAPFSSGTPFSTGFTRAEPGAPLEVPYIAAAAQATADDENEVVLCALRRPPESYRIDDLATDGDGNDDKDPNDIDMPVDPPTGGDVATPCGIVPGPVPDDDPGADSPTTLQQLGVETIPGVEAPADAHFTVNVLNNGYYAFYTRALASDGDDPGNSCTTHTDFGNGAPFFNGLQYDRDHCTIEPLPASFDNAVGIDNTDPVVDINTPDYSETSTVPVEITFASDEMVSDDPAFVDPGHPGQGVLHDFSGIAALECGDGDFEVDVVWTPCGLGFQPITLSGSGSNLIWVRATDAAGNQAVDAESTIVDATAPTSNATLVPPAPASGWYATTPTVVISDWADNTDGSGAPDSQIYYEYWVDGGSPQPCPADPSPTPVCTVNNLNLTTGQHVFHWAAIDRAGNKENGDDPGNTLAINVDNERPQVELLAVPGAPDGDNGWYQRQPFVVLNALDQPGASGLDDDGPAGVFYGLDNPAAPTPFTGYFAVPPGAHTVYFRAVDVAGNSTFLGSLPTCDDVPGPSDPPPSCRQFLVDDAAPVTSISNAAVNGSNGWHVTATPVTVNVTDALPGSTVNAATIPSGTFMSVDGAPLQRYTGPVTMGEGLHSILTYATDVSGQRSEIVQRQYMVDLSAPVSSMRATPPLAARNNWWRTLPSITLRATDGDQNAGVDSIVFRRNGAPAAFGTYTTPFDLNQGTTVVDWRALDRSGPARTEAIRTQTFRVDTGAPTATALNGPLIYIRSHLLHIILGIPLDAPLKWRVSDSLSGKVTVTIQIYNLIGQMVRTLEAGTVTVTPGVPFNGSTMWDGRDYTLTGLIPAGIYYYRVIATDDAGNVAQSGESKPITITIRLL